MAEGELVLCSPLCFLLAKYSNTAVKLLKSALLDYYDAEVLSEAKRQLLKDVNTVKLQVGFDLPHIPARRDGDNRASREVDDMFNLLTILDENLSLSKLPSYVSDGPDRMPSTRLYEGDFGVIMAILEKMENKLNMFGSALSAISRDVFTLKSKSVQGSAGQVAVARGDVNKEAGGQPSGSVLNIETWPKLPEPAGAPPVTSHGDSSVPLTTSGSVTDVMSVNTAVSGSSEAVVNSVGETQWSVLASTPQGHNNRFAVLATTDDESQDDRPYELVRSQRSVRSAAKRLRQQSAVQNNRQVSQPNGRLQTRVTGQLSAAKLGLWAAKKTIKKAIFCIDNVDLACNEDDIRTYVSSLGVEVFSCFKAKPRRRPHESAEDVSYRNAFRLCVNAADRDRLLKPDSWPDSIRIADWFFQSKNNTDNKEEKRRRIDGSDDDAVQRRQSNGNQNDQCVVTVAALVTTAAASVEAMDTVSMARAAGSDVSEEQDAGGDQTTIYQYGECQ